MWVPWDKVFTKITLTLDLLLKETLAITFEPKEIGLSYQRHVDLSVRTKTFDLVTLTLNFDQLLKKNLNLGYNLWTKRDWAFILQVCVPHGKTFLYQHFQLMTFTLTFDLILRNWKCLITIISSQVYKSWVQGVLVLLGQPRFSLH